MSNLLGIDLAVVPNMVAQDASVIDLVARPRPVGARAGRLATQQLDLATLAERENLAQALLLRLLTPRGALTALGHAAYGSRLHELIGQRKNPALRNLCRAYVLEVVGQEPRVEDRAVEVIFDPLAETQESFVFTLVVKPRSGSAPVGLSLEVNL